MRARIRPTTWLIAIMSVIGLVATACSSDGGGPSVDAAPATSPPAADGDVEPASLTGALPGSGATFPMAFYEEAISEFQTIGSGLSVTYGGGGSGKGKQDLADQIVVWAGTDSLVKEDDLAKFQGGEIFYFPTVAAPITVSYNVEGLEHLRLSADTIAAIFQRDVTTWDDPVIAAENPDADLPSEAIVIARRADGSGTTTNFTKYLDRAASNWSLGSGDTVPWPSDTQAGQGNGGVAQIVQSTPGAIGYVDLSDAVASGLQLAEVRNKDGNYVEPTLEAASAALDGADVEADLTYDPLDAAGAGSYPITAPTWVITYQAVSAADHDNLVAWLTFLLTDAQDIAVDVDYAPLPASLQARALAQVAEITAG